MSIKVNSRTVEYKENETITDLLKRMNYSFPLVIVKVDGKVIPKKDQNGTIIDDGQKIDVIHLTSGG